MKEIKIIVMGEVGMGKTTIANQITNILRCGGLDVDLMDDDNPRLPLKECSKRIANMVIDGNLHITVETKQLGRPAFSDIKRMLRDESVREEYTNAISCNCDGGCKRGVRKI